MVLVFHHVIIFFLLSDWLIQILPPFWFCCDVACFCFGSETQLKCTYRRCCQFFKNIVLCLDVLSGGESASMATFFFMTLLLFSRMLTLCLHTRKSFCPWIIYETFSMKWTLIHTNLFQGNGVDIEWNLQREAWGYKTAGRKVPIKFGDGC